MFKMLFSDPSVLTDKDRLISTLALAEAKENLGLQTFVRWYTNSQSPLEPKM